MLKILTAAQTRELDRLTVTQTPIAEIDLMERACRAFTDWFIQRFRQDRTVSIVCGPGNNGGDGLGIARLLKSSGYSVTAWLVRGQARPSACFDINLSRLPSGIPVREIVTAADRGLFADCDVLVDAVLGTGISRQAEGLLAQVISCINESKAITVAVDVPSGLVMDAHTSGPCVAADYTVSFQLPKLAFLLPGNQDRVGEWHLVDIGLHKPALRAMETQACLLTAKSIKKKLQPRPIFSHKGNFGHALLIAGSAGKMGACLLAARAALRAGAGLLTVHTPAIGYTVLQLGLPEAMVSRDSTEDFFSTPPAPLSYTTIGIGPGLGTEPDTVQAFARTLKRFKKPMVIDADGLNILAANPELLPLVPEGSILTPHPKEFERLAGQWANDFVRLDRLKAFAAQLKSVIVLKGAYSAIAMPDGNVFFNPTGNPGMATGGTGDVLTGILTGLMAQGYPAGEAAQIGVFLHGLAGDLAAEELGMNALIASDLVHQLSFAFKKLSRA